jgi:hypothetical protein
VCTRCVAQFSNLDSEDFKTFFLSYFEGRVDGAVLRSIDWQVGVTGLTQVAVTVPIRTVVVQEHWHAAGQQVRHFACGRGVRRGRPVGRRPHGATAAYKQPRLGCVSLSGRRPQHFSIDLRSWKTNQVA